MVQVFINDENVYTKYGLILSHKEIGMPSVQKKMVEVPMRDGSLDYTNVLSDIPRYTNRTITMDFLYLGNNFINVQYSFINDIDGKVCEIRFDDEGGFFFKGMITVTGKAPNKHGGKISVEADCEPFKYDLLLSDAFWTWDDFSFDTGLIMETGNIQVNGEANVSLYFREKRDFPEFESTAQLELEYDGETYIVKQGISKIYNLFFVEGRNEVTFRGNGVVTVRYRGGCL